MKQEGKEGSEAGRERGKVCRRQKRKKCVCVCVGGSEGARGWDFPMMYYT